MSPSRFSELTNGRDYRAPAQVFFELLHTPQMRRRQATSKDRLGWLDRGVVATDASNLSLKAPITVPSEFREVDEDREIAREDGGIKLNLALRVDGENRQPLSVVIMPPTDHETAQFDHLQEDVEVFADLDNPIGIWDRGYTDYGRFVVRNRAGDDFVMTLKANANTSVVDYLKEFTVRDPDGLRHVIHEIIELGETGETFRRVTVEDSDGELTEYLTTLPPEEYAPIDVMDIYTLRTMIQSCFRDQKKTINTQDVHSTALNGVLFELFCTLIAWTLMELYRGRHPMRSGAREAIRTLQIDWNQPLPLTDRKMSLTDYGSPRFGSGARP
jgi:hypothetical protein